MMNYFKKTIFAVFALVLAIVLASCGSQGTDASTSVHEHSFSAEWQKDGDSHWKACTCGEKSEMANHRYRYQKCTVCGAMQESKGLAYDLVDGEYHVTGIGSCTDTAIVIPSTYNGVSVTAIGELAFRGNTSITSVVLGENIKTVKKNCFEGCTSLTTVTFNEKLEKIGYMAFIQCSSLKKVTLPESVEHIEQLAFAWCTSLNTINLPESGCQIDYGTFEGTSYYDTRKNWKDGVLYIGEYAIASDKEACPDKLTVKEGTKYIASSAFRDIYTTEVILPESIVSIGAYAFSGSFVRKINLPKNLETIGEHSLSCGSLKEVTIPLSVKFIGEGAFVGIHAECVITYEGTVLQAKELMLEADAFYDDERIICSDGELIVP